jgi:TrmH family RNA methyltransferase
VKDGLTRAEERLFIALRQREQREARGQFLAEGVRLVEELVASGLAIEMAAISPALEDTRRSQDLAAALGKATQVRRVPESTLRRIAATETPQGVVVMGRTPSWRLESLALDRTARGLILDAIQDPGNFGTLVRSADAFGATFVLALDGTVDPWNPKAVRATAGSAFHLPIVQASATEALALLRNRQVRIVVADMAGTPPDPNMEGPIALVIGNEAGGVREALRAAADAIVGVPVRGRVESLNAAVAGSILLYLLTR